MAEPLFSKHHTWLLVDGDTGKVGITDYAQNKLGDIIFLSLPAVGDAVTSGKSFGDIESVKNVSELISPADGTVLAVNEALIDEPQPVNADPYGSWLIEISLSKPPQGLLTKEEYEALEK